MPVLLDTNICIACLNDSSAAVRRNLTKIPPDEVFISAISCAELRYGANKSKRVEANHRLLDLFFSTVRVLPFDEPSAATYGRLRSHLEAAGKPIGPLDTLIAAQALTHGLTVVTNNEREFKRVPELQVLSWR